MTYRAEIDGLRAISILAVLAFHFFPNIVPNGGVGVDIFFVISGFVITGSIYNRPRNSLGPFLRDFFTRRFKRLVPALVLVVIITSIVISTIDPYPNQSLNTGITALFGLSNIYLYLISQDYFEPTSSLNPFTHTWSLGVEEQFYLIFPFIFWFFRKKVGLINVTFVMSVLAILSVLGWFISYHHDPLYTFYMIFFRFWQVTAGVVAFLLQTRLYSNTATEKLSNFKPVIILLLLFAVFFPVEINRQILILFSTIASGLLLFLIHEHLLISPVLQISVARFFGKISYSLYLWHWPIIVFFSWTYGSNLATALIGLFLSIIIAYLSWMYLERPLRRANWSLFNQKELLTGVLAILVISGTLHIYKDVGREVILGQSTNSTIPLGRSSLFLPYITENGKVWAGLECMLLDGSDIGKKIDVNKCIIGEPPQKAQTRILVIGNSFVPAMISSFDIQNVYNGLKTSFIVSAKFGASPVPDIDWRSHSTDATVDYWRRVVPQLLSKLKRGDQVLIISDLAKLSPEKSSDWADKAREDLKSGLVTLSSELSLKGIGLSILGPLPFLREAKCTPEMALRQAHSAHLQLCKYYDRETTIERQRTIRSMLNSLEIAGFIKVLDLFNIFCPENKCEYTDKNGVLLYRDRYSHASSVAAYRARPLISNWLKTIHESE